MLQTLALRQHLSDGRELTSVTRRTRVKIVQGVSHVVTRTSVGAGVQFSSVVTRSPAVFGRSQIMSLIATLSMVLYWHDRGLTVPALLHP